MLYSPVHIRAIQLYGIGRLSFGNKANLENYEIFLPHIHSSGLARQSQPLCLKRSGSAHIVSIFTDIPVKLQPIEPVPEKHSIIGCGCKLLRSNARSANKLFFRGFLLK